MYLGFIKWFNNEKGYGVIQATETSFAFNDKEKTPPSDEGQQRPLNEIFLHIKNWKAEEPPAEGSEIPLIFGIKTELNKVTAKECRYFDASKDALKLLIEHLGEEEKITVKTGRHSVHTIDIISNGLLSIKRDIQDNPLSRLIRNKLSLLDEGHKQTATETLLRVIQKTDNKSIKSTLKKSLTPTLTNFRSENRLDLWKKDLLSLDQTIKEDFLENIDRVSINNLERISSTDTNRDFLLRILLQKIRSSTNLDKRTLQDISRVAQSCETECNSELIAEAADEMFDREVLTRIKTHKKTNHGSILNTIKETAGLIDAAKQILSKDCVDAAFSTLTYFSKEYGSSTEQIEAALNGYLPPSAIRTSLLANSSEISHRELKQLVDNQENMPKGLFDEIVIKITTPPNIKESQLTSLKVLLGNQEWEDIDTKLNKLLSQEEYFVLWRSGICQISSPIAIERYLDDDSNKYLELERWLNHNLTEEEVLTALTNKLEKSLSPKIRADFQTTINILSFLQKHYPDHFNKYKSSSNSFHKLILWHLSAIDLPDISLLNKKFIYFNPEQQATILKRLFMLKKNGTKEFTIDTLDKLFRADLDLYLTNLQFTNEFILDPSTDFIIETLKSFATTNKFTTNSDLFKLIYRDISSNKKRKFMIESYFDRCPGRLSAKHSWHITRGEVIKTFFGDGNRFYFKIKFEYNEELLRLVKELPGRKYNATEMFWGVPSKYQDHVLEFARKNNFFIDLKSNNYTNNEHLVEYTKEDKPNGIIFCEGKKAKKQMYHKDFWWCANQPCFQNNENLHNLEDWERYTLLDFLHILGYNYDENTRHGYFEIGLYNQLVSQINRFNQLLERLYCRECGDILYPIETGNFGAYNITRFHCLNRTCNQHLKPIYLNHCLNGKCNSIIDSRDSQQCPNGLYICSNCGSCCSHNIFTLRRDNLSKTGESLPSKLLEQIRTKAGHLEKAEYYCYSCGGMMTPDANNSYFYCNQCETEYNLKKYKLSYPHLDLRRPDYPSPDSMPF